MTSRLVWIALILLCLIGAGAVLGRIAMLSTASTAGTPDRIALNAHFQVKAVLILLHIVPSLLLVTLIPLQFSKSIRCRHPIWHRWLGRLTMLIGIIVAVSALRLSTNPVGGLAEGTATTFFGCFFLFSLTKAWWHIRRRRVQLHREWVMRMCAIALGVATTRPIIAVFFATSRLTGLTPHQFFGPAMWLGFVSTYLAGEAWINHTRARTLDDRLKPALELTT